MGAITHPVSTKSGQVKLADEASLRIGTLDVDPPTRQVSFGTRHQTVEPRVMQVLVALARVDGHVVSRDTLVECCWDGLAVSEDAINRVMSRLRQLAADIGGGSFSIETIRGVGYRLIEDGHERSTSSFSRRATISATAGLVMIAGFGAWLLPRQKHQPLPLAVQYYQRGIETRGQASLEQAERGTAFFREAARIDPQYADAWGALAWNYRGLIEFDPKRNTERLSALSRSAAKRALELDPGNSDAQAALLLLRPFFSNWLTIDRGLRVLLERHPHNSILEFNLGYVMGEVGRWKDAIPLLRSVAQRERFWPLPQAQLAFALHSTGQDEEAEDLIDDGMKRFPRRIDYWLTKVRYLMHSGRAHDALGFINDADSLLTDSVQPIVAFQRIVANALADGSSAARNRALKQMKEEARNNLSLLYSAAVESAYLGDLDIAFSMLNGFYFGRGPWAAGRRERPFTNPLFGPPITAFRADRRFPELLRATGLEAYWQASGTQPDFRRFG
jgi:DNA-binding winged helix-turn-helix (wHTH) protein/tetratricopeptide (TPR) repeat protein